MKRKVFISTLPFADVNKFPLEMLESNQIEYELNSLGRKLTEDEMTKMVADADVIIAGTEPITSKVLAQAKNSNISLEWE